MILTKSASKNPKNTAILICGDFNAEPFYECIQDLKQINFLKNAYNDCSFTTFKIRDKLCCRTIDYMFYSDNLNMIGKSELPKKEEIGEKGLPNEIFPSDHLSLFAIFNYN